MKKFIVCAMALGLSLPVYADCVLKQSTASQNVLIGPFLDATDGNTPETGLTITNTDVRLSAAGGNIAAKNSGGGTHDELGMYQITLDATDTATVGSLDIVVAESGALIVWEKCIVLEEDIYDNFYASGAAFETSGDIADAVWDEALSGHSTAGTAGKAVTDIETDATAILVDTGTTLDGKLDTAQSDLDTITGSDGVTLATAQGNYAPATASALTTVDSNVDAIKAKTDDITFTNTNEVDVNVKSMNDAEVCGDGTSGDKWTGVCP